MCVVSNAMDHFRPQFDPWKPYIPTVTSPNTAPRFPYLQPLDLGQAKELKDLIERFKEAIAAAATVDRLTGQPDCEDPEKGKLRDQVARLEKVVDRLLAENEALRAKA